MEIYLPRHVLRETKRIVVAEAVPHPEDLSTDWWLLAPSGRRYFGAFAAYKRARLYKHMNNFRTFFPDRPDGSSYRKRQYANLGLLDLTAGEWYEKRGIMIDELQHPLLVPSLLFLGQTGREFLQTVDDVIAHYQIDTDLVRNLLETGRLQNTATQLSRAYRLIFPVFVHLKALGYNNQELR